MLDLGQLDVRTSAARDQGWLDQLLAPYLEPALATLADRAPLLATMVRYHLGQLDDDLQPAPAGAIDRGKRIRPLVAILATVATGGLATTGAAVATSIELLHNFTLIHDDIQDESPLRRHRPTVWHKWDIKQAINAGDALFAAAHLPFFALPAQGVPAERCLALLDAFARTTIAIVEGQTLDLSFEGRDDVTAADYLTMIRGKTAAIVEYAAWAGGALGTDDPARTARFREFGLALGLGYQLRDDLLGIWGDAATTGKAPADDIRRRKQSLPILLLRERASPADRAEITGMYAAAAIAPAGIERVLALLTHYDVQATVEAAIATHHDEARAALLAATGPEPNPGRDQLLALTAQLASRAG